MSKAIFIYKDRITEIQCYSYESMKWICQRFANKLNLDINKLSFKYNGKEINGNLLYKKHISENDKKNKIMKILVSYKNIIQQNKPNINIKNETLTNNYYSRPYSSQTTPHPSKIIIQNNNDIILNNSNTKSIYNNKKNINEIKNNNNNIIFNNIKIPKKNKNINDNKKY